MIFQAWGEINPIQSQHLVLIICALPTAESQEHKITSSSAKQQIQEKRQKELMIDHGVPSCIFCSAYWSGRLSWVIGQRKDNTFSNSRGYSHWIWWYRISNSEGPADHSPCRWSSPAEIKTEENRIRRGNGKNRQKHTDIEIRQPEGWTSLKYIQKDVLNLGCLKACRK